MKLAAIDAWGAYLHEHPVSMLTQHEKDAMRTDFLAGWTACERRRRGPAR